MGLFRKKRSAIEEDTFYQMYHATAQYVVGNILRGCGSAEDVEECVNDALYQAMASMDKYDEKRGTVKTFVGVIARSTALMRRRELTRHPTVSFDEVSQSDAGKEWQGITITYEPEHQIEYQELVLSIIRGLKPREQELFTLYFLMQMPPADIAKRLHITRGAVDTRVNRLRKKMIRELLNDPVYQDRYRETDKRRENVIYIEDRRKGGA